MDSSDQPGAAPIEQIGNYRVLKRLGEGGFGEVYLGESTAGLTRQVAIKVFRPKDENVVAFATSSDEEGLAVLRERFVREANILVQLEDAPHVINVHELGELDDGSPYYVMGYVHRALSAETGRDVFTAAQEELPKEERPRSLAFERARDLFEQILDGVAAAHAKGLVHRDLKPSNLLLTDDDQIRVADFGIAKAPDAQHSTVSQLGIGSRNYMAPEQRESAKHVDARADVYALGVIAYRMFTGRLPSTRMQDPNVLCPAMSPALNQLILDCLEEDREARPADAGAVLQRYRQAKQRVVNGDATSTSTKTSAGPAPQTIRDELAPLRERVLQLLTAHGEVPDSEWETLEVMGAVEGLDAGAVRGLAEQVAGEAGDELKRLRAFLALIDDRVAEHGADLPDSTRSALHMGGSRVGWDEAQVDARIVDVGARVEAVEPAGAADPQPPARAEAQNRQAIEPAKPVGLDQVEDAGAETGRRRTRVSDWVFSSVGLLVVGTVLWFATTDDGADQERIARPSPSISQATGSSALRPESSRPQSVERDEASSRAESRPLPGSTFRDRLSSGGEGPQMVVVPAGSFRMGCVSGQSCQDEEQPVHAVRIGASIAFGMHEVTVSDFRRFVDASSHRTDAERDGGCVVRKGDSWERELARSWRSPGFTQSDDHPVTCVSWNDAQAYVQWLSEQTRESYRLPTEAEWEFAARGGTETAWYFGNHESGLCAYGNFSDRTAGRTSAARNRCADGVGPLTAMVGSFRPNAFRLHDVIGNVSEWTQDCWHETYQGAPADGTAWEAGDDGECRTRVVRGGSWNFEPTNVRSAFRYRSGTPAGFNIIGFRVVREL